MFGPNGRFLHGVFHRWFREELLALLGRYGVETKVERGGRIFPASDDAADVVNALRRYLADQGVDLKTEVRVTGIALRDGRVAGIRTEAGLLPAGAVILATGGATWPATGSSGDGYPMAAALGHTVTKLRPALVPLVVAEIERAKSMQGVSLRNVRLTAFRLPAERIDPALTPAKDCGRGIDTKRRRGPVIESRMGEMLFTHFGIGGPITLLMSLSVVDALAEGPVGVSIDLKPALTRKSSGFASSGTSIISANGVSGASSPASSAQDDRTLCRDDRYSPERPGHQIAAGERERLLSLLKSLRFNIKGPLPLSSAIVTAGGVSLKEVDPRTMASRIVDGLFFCGEVLDLDADTGGYNLQAAFSTGYVAGEEAASFVQDFAEKS